MEEEEVCNMGLCLSIGLGDHLHGHGHGHEYVAKKEQQKKEKKSVSNNGISFSSFPFHATKDEAAVLDYDNINNNYSSRKKLRLTQEQISVLENTFKLRTTLNLAQKQKLAEGLNLMPRQVEVWFQNRRARTKSKQTEIDCGLLKKCCERLSDENQRLKKELQELMSLKPQQPPFRIEISKAPVSITKCPSCHKIVKSEGYI